MMPDKPLKRPRDPAQLAKLMIDIASGGLRADVEFQTAGRQAGNIQTERGGRASRVGVKLRRGPIARRGAVQYSGDGGSKPFRAESGRWVFSSAPALPASFANWEAAGHCRFTAAARDCRHPSVRRRLTVRRGRAQDRDHGRIPGRQPLAHQPCHLRRGHAIRSRLQSEPGPNSKSKSYWSKCEKLIASKCFPQFRR
jgi:hypothetical protein